MDIESFIKEQARICAMKDLLYMIETRSSTDQYTSRQSQLFNEIMTEYRVMFYNEYTDHRIRWNSKIREAISLSEGYN